MEKTIKILTMLCFVVGIGITSLSGQRAAKFWWFDAGAKVQYGVTGMENPTLRNSNDWTYDLGTGLSYGVKLGMNKGTSGLTIDVMTSSNSASYEDKRGGGDLSTNLDWRTIDLYPMFRHNRQLGYVEIGPKFSLMRMAEFTNAESITTDMIDNFENNNVNAVLGFGAYFIGSDGAFSGILGLRFEYGLTDIVNPSGYVNGAPLEDPAFYPDPMNVEGLTRPFFAGVSFELNWGIGYVGKTNCGGRSKFIKF